MPLVALALSGCAGGQTGTEEWGKGTTGHGEPCDAHPSELAPDVGSPLGFALSDVVAAVSGTRSASLEWRSLEPDVEVAPEQGASSIELSLGNIGASGRFVHYTPKASAGDEVNTTCPPDELAFDAELSVLTAGGALAELRKVVVHVSQANRATIFLELPWSELRGSLRATPRTGLTLKDPVLDLELTATSTRGQLTGLLEQQSSDGASVGARYLTYACWPADAVECGQP